MSLAGDIHKLDPGALIDLFILDLSSIGIPEVYYFYPGSDANLDDVVFQGQTYVPFPIAVEGFEKRGTGAEARPRLIVSNYLGFITSKLKLYEDLVGALLKRRRTLEQYLGTGTEDTSTFIEDLYFIEQKSAENALAVEFTLSSAMDFIGKRLPSRIAVANSCPWQYKTTDNGSGCGWPGTDSGKWFDATGTAVIVESEDVCGKRLSDCKLRFGEVEPLDFGGFPSLGRV